MTQPTAPLIVLVEDEEHLAQGLLFNLQAEGYRTHHESDGDSALAWLLSNKENPAAIVLDCMLPGADGFTIVRALREAQHYTPVLMLTARSRPEEVLEGIEAGADDYLAKPFDLNILLVRLKSLLRRTAWQNAATPETPPPAISDQRDEYAFNHRTIRFDTLELIAPNRTTHLTPTPRAPPPHPPPPLDPPRTSAHLPGGLGRSHPVDELAASLGIFLV